MENKEIRIVRFKDGVDVICFYDRINNEEVELTSPMMFEIRNTNLQMVHWLPLTIMKTNSVVIEKNSILCTFEPADDFTEYYITVTDKLSSIDKDKFKQKDQEEVKEIMEALTELETIKGIPIH
jgi:hypothetical protein